MVKYKQTVEKGEKAGKKLSLLTHDTKDVGVSRSHYEDCRCPHCGNKINAIQLFKILEDRKGWDSKLPHS